MLLNQKDESSKSFVWLTITIHILPIILLSKSNKTNKIGQLIEYSKIYILINYFDSPQFEKKKKKKLYITLDYWSRDMLIFIFLGKGLGIVSPHFVYNFSRKKLFHVNLYYLTKSLCLITLTSWDIRQYVHCNCLFLRLWRRKFWN